MSAVPISRRAAVAGAVAALGLAGAAPAPSPVARTRPGAVRGFVDRGVLVFKGLRYGDAPPRFRPAGPPAPWTGIAEATAYGAASPQGGAIVEPTSEDCLFLNLWTPSLDAGARRPVMVYIHGGAYAHGSGSDPLYDGVRLCRRGDVVVVTLNHRLGAFGHLYLGRLGPPDLAASGNVGILDLVLALEWVRDNIAAFGGDPRRVMVFGQSGGGAKIATLMATPAARGLFHRAATMSGQQVTASGPLNATLRARALLDALGLAPTDLDRLRTLPADQIVRAMAATDPIIGKGELYFGPVFDGQVLPRHPFYPDAPPQSAAIPMIIGNTRDETRNLIGRGDPHAFDLAWDEVPARLAAQMRTDIAPEIVVAEYRRLHPAWTPSEVFFAATTAARSWRAAVIEAELRAAQGAPAYVYQVDWPSPLDGGRWRAPHMIDIPLVFDTVAQPGALTGSGPEAQRMADQMSEAFIAFARNGDPNTAAIPRWIPYGLERRETLIFDRPSRLENDPRGAERRLFARAPFIQQGT